MDYSSLPTANCSDALPEDIVIVNSTSSQLTRNCFTSMVIVKTAVCVHMGNGIWLPQVSCGCTRLGGNHVYSNYILLACSSGYYFIRAGVKRYTISYESTL